MEDTSNNKDQNQNQKGGGDAGKIEKGYQIAIGRVVALFKGEKNLKAKKSLPHTEASEVIDELIADRIKERKEEFKKQAATLIEKHVEFVKFEREAKQKFEQEILKKKKEFTADAQKVLQLVDGIDQLRKDWEASLKTVMTTEEEEEEEQEEPEGGSNTTEEQQ